ncbi:hypothetical protein [Ewingella americana]|uniref:Uncharacterized protein n=1 Tax=Ewingella americana TaxID=41202 RepID=A0A502GDE5_9GAMM|nr:hypothetical protein [Ewingella americana]TPG59884.1 hypothetical protein EAH77_15065 [Ewingella americana]
MSDKVPLTIGDVAAIRALARQIQLLRFDNIEFVKNAIHDELSHEVSSTMLEMLSLLCDPDVVDDLCGRAIADFHTTGEI